MKNIITLLFLALLILQSSCSDKVYSYRKKVKVDNSNKTAKAESPKPVYEKAKIKTTVVIRNETSKEEELKASVPAAMPVLVNEPAATREDIKAAVSKIPAATKQGLQKRMISKKEIRKKLKEFSSVSDSNGLRDASGGSLMITGLILILIGVLAGIFIPVVGYILGVVGTVLLIVGLILFLMAAV